MAPFFQVDFYLESKLSPLRYQYHGSILSYAQCVAEYLSSSLRMSWVHVNIWVESRSDVNLCIACIVLSSSPAGHSIWMFALVAERHGRRLHQGSCPPGHSHQSRKPSAQQWRFITALDILSVVQFDVQI